MKKCCAYCRLVVIEHAERRSNGQYDISWKCLYEGPHHSVASSREYTSLFLVSCPVYDPYPEEVIVADMLAGRFG
jgi:hypothetical protein